MDTPSVLLSSTVKGNKCHLELWFDLIEWHNGSKAQFFCIIQAVYWRIQIEIASEGKLVGWFKGDYFCFLVKRTNTEEETDK